EIVIAVHKFAERKIVFGGIVLQGFVPRLDQLYFRIAIPFQERIDLLEKLPRDHRSEVPALLLSLLFVPLLVPPTSFAHRRVLFSLHLYPSVTAQTIKPIKFAARCPTSNTP